jgi:hypothetical protein
MGRKHHVAGTVLSPWYSALDWTPLENHHEGAKFRRKSNIKFSTLSDFIWILNRGWPGTAGWWSERGSIGGGVFFIFVDSCLRGEF